MHDELPAEMEVVEGNNFRAVWKWPGPKTYDLSYEFLCPKRGLYELGETLWDTEGPLGLQRRNRGTAGETQEFSVVPRIQAVRRLKEVRARAHTRFFRTDLAAQGPSTTDFKDLRPYSPGDPMRIVNWKASARNSYGANPLLVNQYEAEGRKAIWILPGRGRVHGSGYYAVVVDRPCGGGRWQHSPVLSVPGVHAGGVHLQHPERYPHAGPGSQNSSNVLQIC